MYAFRRLSHVLESAVQIPIDDSDRIILMSDVHRGDGSWADDFSRNHYIYSAAMAHYYERNFTYIEIGDGDELWKNKKLSEIMNVHSEVFSLLSRFFKEGRLYFIYGNHDMVKKSPRYVRNNLFQYFSEREKRIIPLFKNVVLHEGIVLKHTLTGGRILLVHGHQADYFNDRLWKLSRFLVRYLWRPLESYGVNNPTSAAKNYVRKVAVEKKIIEWVKRNNIMLIAGHTHRPTFPKAGYPPYFNDGSCVHPQFITCIEIAAGSITLVKWGIKARNDGTMYVGREVLAGPEKLFDYFNTRIVYDEEKDIPELKV